MCLIALKSIQRRFNNLQNFSKLANNCQRLLKCCHFGGISPNLVTLLPTYLLKRIVSPKPVLKIKKQREPDKWNKKVIWTTKKGRRHLLR